MFKINESIIVIQAEATSPNRTNVIFWSHDRGTAKLRMKLVRKNGIPQSLPEGTTVPIRLIFKSATAEGGYGKHDYLATIEDRVNGIVSIVLEDNILGYVGKVEGSVYIDFPNDRSLDTAGRFTFDIKRSPIDDSTPELEDYYFNGFSQIIDKIEKILADGKQEIDAKLKDTNDKITKANQKITEYDQNLNELRNDLKLSEAWAWSADGTDRFTDKYPIDNLLPNSMFNSQMGWTASMSDVGSTQSGIANGEAWLEDLTATTNRWKQWQIYFDNNRYPDTFELIKANPNKRVIVSVDAKVEGNTIKYPGVVDLSLRSSTGDNWVRLRVDDTKISSEYTCYTAIGTLPSDFNNVQNFRLILTFNGNGRATFTKPKLAIGNDGFYTPAPSEDYENAYPDYIGLALAYSDKPEDYLWLPEPTKNQKKLDELIKLKGQVADIQESLNDTVSLTEPQSIEGLKNFEDGAQIDGVDVATVKNLGSVLQSGSGLTTIQSDKQSAFDEFSYEFERIGDRVFFHARVKTNSTTAVASHVNLLEIPLGFQFPIGWTIVGIPLSVVQWTTPQGEISALVITDSNGKQVVKFATNRVGNHYISGEWRTADSYPETK